ncbi:MAG: PCMD domain-containing protein, partial [Mucinivorans sp.]
SFDEGYWSGSYWYPNASGGNSYWATGNDGVVAGPVSMSANNRHEEQDVIKGKAVRLTSVRITFGLSPVKFAGGSIFTGDYKTNMSNPVSSVKFGRAYTGRPLGLKGWYKYKPQIINQMSTGQWIGAIYIFRSKIGVERRLGRIRQPLLATVNCNRIKR